jgi:hypothetical protein
MDPTTQGLRESVEVSNEEVIRVFTFIPNIMGTYSVIIKLMFKITSDSFLYLVRFISVFQIISCSWDCTCLALV